MDVLDTRCTRLTTSRERPCLRNYGRKGEGSTVIDLVHFAKSTDKLVTPDFTLGPPHGCEKVQTRATTAMRQTIMDVYNPAVNS